MRTILRVIKKYLKEIVLIICGIIAGAILRGREKERKLTEKITKEIQEATDMGQKQKEVFREQLERINCIANDKDRMEAKLKLWEFLQE